MKETIAFPQLVELIAQRATTTTRMSELFLQELFVVISQELTEGKSVKINGLGTFKSQKTDTEKHVIFVPDKELAQAVNAPFAQFKPVELCETLTKEQLDEIDASMTPKQEEPAQEMTVILELKLLADVGLVGFPNAGKSTLVSALSNAKPKIANYPFTTMEPSLGIVGYRDQKSFVMADIPGIIEGAAEGKGLGLRFLRHIERNSILLFMVSCEQLEIAKEYHVLLDELKKYNPELLDKQRLLAVTKCDMMDEQMQKQLKRRLPKGIEAVFISAVSGQGITELKDKIFAMLNA